MSKMRIVSFNQNDVASTDFWKKFIHDWYSLGQIIQVPTTQLSHVLRNKSEYVRKHNIKGRTVYASHPSLEFIQKRLLTVLTPIQESIPNAHMLAYRKGVNPRDSLKTCVGFDIEISVDIKKYFDNISHSKIVDTLKFFGFSHEGASLISRYCTVQRTVKGNKISTLQQGSATSSVLSNLVGYHLFDQAIMSWLEQQKKKYPNFTYKFFRYCDNLALFASNVPEEFVEQYKTTVDNIMHSVSFRTHEWTVTAHNHPRRAQRFLGVVLNNELKLSESEFRTFRSTLFNSCVYGLTAMAIYNVFEETKNYRFASFVSTKDFTEALAIDKGESISAIKESFMRKLRGKVSYLKTVNTEQYTQALKLYNMAVELDALWFSNKNLASIIVGRTPHYQLSTGYTLFGALTRQFIALPIEVFQAVKNYKDSSVDVTEYVNTGVSLIKNYAEMVEQASGAVRNSRGYSVNIVTSLFEKGMVGSITGLYLLSSKIERYRGLEVPTHQSALSTSREMFLKKLEGLSSSE